MDDYEKTPAFKQLLIIILLIFVVVAVGAWIIGTSPHGSYTAASPPTETAQNTYSSTHKPGEKFVVTLPGANGGSTQAEIIMMGSYRSSYGEGDNGYSWYYNISIKNIGDRGIQLPMAEYAEDNSGISVHIDQLYYGHYIVLHPGEVGTSFGGAAISNKIYLLQSQKTPRGGGIYHLNLGGTIIDFNIPETNEFVKKVSVSTTKEPISIQTVTTTQLPDYKKGDIIGSGQSIIIIDYNSWTDRYQYDKIFQNDDRSWGYRLYPDYNWEDRLTIERNYPNLQAHLDPSKIITKFRDKESYQNWLDQR